MFRGSTKDGQEDFDKFVTDWDEDILNPFDEFLQKVYRASGFIFSAFVIQAYLRVKLFKPVSSCLSGPPTLLNPLVVPTPAPRRPKVVQLLRPLVRETKSRRQSPCQNNMEVRTELNHDSHTSDGLLKRRALHSRVR